MRLYVRVCVRACVPACVPAYATISKVFALFSTPLRYLLSLQPPLPPSTHTVTPPACCLLFSARRSSPTSHFTFSDNSDVKAREIVVLSPPNLPLPIPLQRHVIRDHSVLLVSRTAGHHCKWTRATTIVHSRKPRSVLCELEQSPSQAAVCKLTSWLFFADPCVVLFFFNKRSLSPGTLPEVFASSFISLETCNMELHIEIINTSKRNGTKSTRVKNKQLQKPHESVLITCHV